MRDHGCYMYSQVEKEDGTIITIDKIRYGLQDNFNSTNSNLRDWMGNFSSSKNVPKLMSRMGQCFTQAQVLMRRTNNRRLEGFTLEKNWLYENERDQFPLILPFHFYRVVKISYFLNITSRLQWESEDFSSRRLFRSTPRQGINTVSA